MELNPIDSKAIHDEIDNLMSMNELLWIQIRECQDKIQNNLKRASNLVRSLEI